MLALSLVLCTLAVALISVSVSVCCQVAGLRERLTALSDRLGLRSGPLLVPAALSLLLESGLMGDRDRAMAADLCCYSSDRRQDADTPAVAE